MACCFRTSENFPDISNRVQKRPHHFLLFLNQHFMLNFVAKKVKAKAISETGNGGS
jgi:hypothetical protein